MNHYSRLQKTNPKKNSNSNSNPSHSNSSHMRLRTSRNPILNPQNSKNINQIHLATKKSIKNTQILRTNRIQNPSNLRSKAKKKSRAVPATHRVCAENLAATDRLAYATYRLGDGTVHLGLVSLCSGAPFFLRLFVFDFFFFFNWAWVFG